MEPASQHTPLIAWGRACAEELLTRLVKGPAPVRHHCPACGATTHGRPWTRLADRTGPDISVAHAGALTVVALVRAGRVGVDVEPADRIPPPGISHPDDPAADLTLWTRKEAYLKATGDGLRRDPATVGPHEPGATWGTIDLGPGYVATWCRIRRPDRSAHSDSRELG